MLNMLVLFMNFYDEQYNKKKGESLVAVPQFVFHGPSAALTHTTTAGQPCSVRWTIINGKRYDISKFVNEHPGGSDLIMLAVGRDASIMFGSYHRRLDVAMVRCSSLPLTCACVAHTLLFLATTSGSSERDA